MKSEEFEQLKNEYKKHFRELKALKEKHREVARKQELSQALQNIVGQTNFDDFNDIVRQVEEETAGSEARVDIALQQAAEEVQKEGYVDPEEDRKLRARATLEALRKDSESKADQNEDDRKQKQQVKSDLKSQKTIGPK